MLRILSRTLLFVSTLIASSDAVHAQGAQEEAETLKDALAKGTPSVDLRYRYEFVDDAAFDLDAHASTLRTSLAYRTLPFRGLSLFMQAQNVTDVGEDNYNNRGAGHLANGVSQRPVVVDPSQTRMQQVYLRVDGFDTAIDLGRREITYGDHRFIGNIGWRQNHQAFDGVYLSSQALKRTTLSYTFADNVVRIFGDKKEMSSHFLNGLVRVNPDVTLELFGYLLDYDEERDFSLSSQTYGLRLLGGHRLSDDFKLLFEAEYAKQTDFADNPAELNADYLELVGGIGIAAKLNLRVGRERLGAADGPLAFQTPLATGHKFNGWADKFLVTPKNGLVDRYLSVDGKLKALSWLVAYHDFSADEGGAAYASELDAQAVYPTEWGQAFGLKFALFRTDGFSTDTSKVWLWTQYSF